ncbi:MAG TPA: peptide chain release factor N(5)-glutamine methyltransferase [Myxococcota bacterium]|nr:peptide chain release factor N(5)-glutamine methyltransferase [Myxococcota bacterium]
MSGPVARAPERPAARRAWTVLELLRWTTGHFSERGIESARLDAECLLAHALGTTRLRLYLDFEKPVEEAERAGFRELVRRRVAERVPVSQLVGRKEFWSLSLRVTRDVLTPRPETETLVAVALELLPPKGGAPPRVLDLGTGSGAIALALASERPDAAIVATDLSQEALKVAQQNAEELGMAERIRFAQGDGFAAVVGQRFDAVVSNPPYLDPSERSQLPPELSHEPGSALFAGTGGLELLRRIASEAPSWLESGGALILEHAPDQAQAVARACSEAGLTEIGLRLDLGGKPRVTTARRAVDVSARGGG